MDAVLKRRLGEQADTIHPDEKGERTACWAHIAVGPQQTLTVFTLQPLPTGDGPFGDRWVRWPPSRYMLGRRRA